MTGNIIIGSDHRGCAMKAALKEFMQGLGMTVEDAGPFTDAPADYPEFAAKVASGFCKGWGWDNGTTCVERSGRGSRGMPRNCS